MNIITLPSIADRVLFTAKWRHVAYYRGRKKIKWEIEWENKIFDAGMTDILRTYWGFKAAELTSAWAVGFMNASPTVDPGDTPASHPGWTENTNYVSAVRPAWNPDDPVGVLTITNSTPVTIVCNQNGSVFGGAFIISDNTKGGITGTMTNGGAFTQGNKPLEDQESMDTTVSITFGSLT